MPLRLKKITAWPHSESMAADDEQFYLPLKWVFSISANVYWHTRIISIHKIALGCTCIIWLLTSLRIGLDINGVILLNECNILNSKNSS